MPRAVKGTELSFPLVTLKLTYRLPREMVLRPQRKGPNVYLVTQR